MDNQKGLKTVAIFSIVIIVFGGIILVWLWLGTPTKQTDIPEQNNIKSDIENWNIFTDNEVGYSLRYPEEFKEKQAYIQELRENFTSIIFPVVFASEEAQGKWRFGSDYLLLGIERQKIDDITDDFPPSPPGYTKEVVLQDEEFLKKGEFGYLPPFSLEESQKIIKIDDKIYGKEFTTLAMFEVCDVLPTRTLIFFKNGYKVTLISQIWSVEKMQSELPQYFTTDQENCGDSLIWGWEENSQLKFYNDLIDGRIDSQTEAGIWYNTFNKVISTIDLFGDF